ncbi:hypothetical protein D3C81_386890 [compost metagenome]
MLIKLILENYIPLLSSGITKVELDVEHMVNLFIAANGTGKTSILRELSPLPPENGNYRTGGRKYVKIKAGAKMFILDSYTGIGNGHSFKLDGHELNKNGTYSEQKELVWFYFKLDSNIHRILSGLKAVDLFSMMSANRRKEFFMHLYPNDTTYALGVWSKLKQEKNELKAQIKGQIARYTEENGKLQKISECGVEDLEHRIKVIEDELRQSLLVRGGLENVRLDSALGAKIERFNKLTERLAVSKISGFIETEEELIGGIAIMEGCLARHEEQASGIQMVISEHASALEGMEELLEDPLAFNHQAEQLQAELTSMQTELEQHTTLLQNFPMFNEEGYDFTGLEHIHQAFEAALRRVVTCSSEELSGAQYKGYTVKHEQVSANLRHAKQELETITHKLKHYDNAEMVQCPDCEHEFKVGITAEELQKLRDSKVTFGNRITNLTEELNQLTTLIENDREWYESMMALYSFCRVNGDVRCLAELVKNYDIGKGETSVLLNAIRCYMGQFECKKRINALLDEQGLLNTRIGLLQKDTLLDVAAYIKGWEHDLEVENRRIAFYKNKLKHLMGSLSYIQNYNNNLEELKELREDILKGLENEGLVDLRQRVDHRIGLLSEEKEEYLASIIRSRSLTAVVTSISEDIDRLKRRLKGVEILMDGLCPNKGLIGRLMTDFIKTWCGNVNSILQIVWNTPLYVKPCNKDNGDLTYKFPVVTGDQDPTPDVQDCSLGQAGIIDLAARLVSLTYHGQEYPWIMDEVGTAFDEIKRGRFLNFVQDLTSRKDARQLFMVSHYLTQYGAFTNPNIVAMRYEGLTAPGEVNKHSTII